jgi:serine/threonine-protein kinase
VLDRQFQLGELIGAGAMAHVYRARQLGVDRDVAVKILRRELLTRADVVARFQAEAALTARLSHPHVVVVHAVGEMAPNAEPYVVLEWLEGVPLSKVLASAGGALSLARAVHVMLALSDAVGEAHAHGIVHRDLKPDNVMLVRRGDDPDFVKLLDFGLAKSLEERVDPRTRAGSILGTPRYVSPEGAEGQLVTKASDCYSLATLLYETVTGRTPFQAESAVQLLAAQATVAPPDVRQFAPGGYLPEPLAAFIMRNLDKRPSGRAEDARAFGRGLATAAREAGLDASEIGLSATLTGGRSPLAALATPGTEPEPGASLPAPRSGSAPAPTALEPNARAGTDRPNERTQTGTHAAGSARPIWVLGVCFIVGALAAAAIAASANAPHAGIGAKP